jgi:hypothetical protein
MLVSTAQSSYLNVAHEICGELVAVIVVDPKTSINVAAASKRAAHVDPEYRLAAADSCALGNLCSLVHCLSDIEPTVSFLFTRLYVPRNIETAEWIWLLASTFGST